MEVSRVSRPDEVARGDADRENNVLKHAPHPEAAVKFLEYLVSEEAQHYFADGNNEYPAVNGVAANSVLEKLGSFKADPVNVSVLGETQPQAQRIFDRVGWQ